MKRTNYAWPGYYFSTVLLCGLDFWEIYELGISEMVLQLGYFWSDTSEGRMIINKYQIHYWVKILHSRDYNYNIYTCILGMEKGGIHYLRFRYCSRKQTGKLEYQRWRPGLLIYVFVSLKFKWTFILSRLTETNLIRKNIIQSGAMNVLILQCCVFFLFLSVYTRTCLNYASIFNFSSSSDSKVKLVGTLRRLNFEFPNSFQKHREKQKK
ncbi:Uncharacterized protein FWK35_00015714 [Aphis craccivora]|uniref:Uncharacterized protein n=1 Tax=Aphis craccivora TaxID=307492 RepID=A0A6G0ZHW6_APHCR|nr:Uncharacterized protein FWK35_00015714 [Aphis craccivora]